MPPPVPASRSPEPPVTCGNRSMRSPCSTRSVRPSRPHRWRDDMTERPPSFFVRARRDLVAMGVVCALISGCGLPSWVEPGAPGAGRAAAASRASGEPSTRALTPQEAHRLQRVMAPLVSAMDRPRTADQIRIGIMDDARINAASGGDGAFYVTTGLLEKATDLQLVGVLAHELAHDDLGHVARA